MSKILWCPADEQEEADRVAAEARHVAANEPLPRAVRSLNVCAEINERQAAEARRDGRDRMADYHAEVAASCRADAQALLDTAVHNVDPL